MEEEKDLAEIPVGRLMGITEQKVCWSVPLRRDAIKRSRSRGWKWQQEEHRRVLHRGLRGRGIHLAAARGGGGEDTFAEVQRAEGRITLLFHFSLLRW